MPDGLIAFRKTDRLTRKCQVLGVDATHPCGNHRYDPVEVLPAAQLANTSDQERTDFAWIMVTDVPVAVALKVKRWFTKPSTVGDPPAVDRPRILNLAIALFKAEYPGQEANIDKLFEVGRTQTIASIQAFALPWSKVKLFIKNVLLDRLMSDAEWEADPNGA